MITQRQKGNGALSFTPSKEELEKIKLLERINNIEKNINKIINKLNELEESVKKCQKN